MHVVQVSFPSTTVRERDEACPQGALGGMIESVISYRRRLGVIGHLF